MSYPVLAGLLIPALSEAFRFFFRPDGIGLASQCRNFTACSGRVRGRTFCRSDVPHDMSGRATAYNRTLHKIHCTLSFASILLFRIRQTVQLTLLFIKVGWLILELFNDAFYCTNVALNIMITLKGELAGMRKELSH